MSLNIDEAHTNKNDDDISCCSSSGVWEEDTIPSDGENDSKENDKMGENTGNEERVEEVVVVTTEKREIIDGKAIHPCDDDNNDEIKDNDTKPSTEDSCNEERESEGGVKDSCPGKESSKTDAESESIILNGFPIDRKKIIGQYYYSDESFSYSSNDESIDNSDDDSDYSCSSEKFSRKKRSTTTNAAANEHRHQRLGVVQSQRTEEEIEEPTSLEGVAKIIEAKDNETEETMKDETSNSEADESGIDEQQSVETGPDKPSTLSETNKKIDDMTTTTTKTTASKIKSKRRTGNKPVLNKNGKPRKMPYCETHEKLWNRRYAEAEAFKKKFGHLSISRRGNPLGNWLQNQRQQYRLRNENKVSHITDERIEKLNKLGIVWQLKENAKEQWNIRFEQIKKFKAQFGHTNCSLSTDRVLGKWVSILKSSFVSKFFFVCCSFLNFYPLLMYVQVDTQRTNYKLYMEGSKCKRLTHERIKLLDGIDFMWSTKNIQWNKQYNNLCEHKKKHGHLIIDASKYPKLSDFLHSQRKQYKKYSQGMKCQLTKERVDKLNALGVIWNVVERAHWWRNYRELLEYRHNNNGDLECPELANWIRDQREQYNLWVDGNSDSKMTQSRVDFMNDINFVWVDPNEDKQSSKCKTSASKRKKAKKDDITVEKGNETIIPDTDAIQPTSSTASSVQERKNLPQSTSSRNSSSRSSKKDYEIKDSNGDNSPSIMTDTDVAHTVVSTTARSIATAATESASKISTSSLRTAVTARDLTTRTSAQEETCLPKDDGTPPASKGERKRKSSISSCSSLSSNDSEDSFVFKKRKKSSSHSHFTRGNRFRASGEQF